MKLHTENKSYIVKGFYNRGEETFIAQYFIGYGGKRFVGKTGCA